jgi:hypothetical protein
MPRMLREVVKRREVREVRQDRILLGSVLDDKYLQAVAHARTVALRIRHAGGEIETIIVFAIIVPDI